jgi:tRNA(Ile)-lysidine synthase
MRRTILSSDFFERHSPQKLGIKKIFCGFSGGADSSALLLFLRNNADKYGLEVKAVHFQHGLRGKESFDDAQWCRNFCESRGIDFMEINLNAGQALKGKESYEDAARRLRLGEWKVLSSQKSCAAALGHNSDDRNENMVIRILRGSNVSGLTSLRELQTVEGILFLRPLLNFTRKQIEDFLETENSTDWRTDSSNLENECLRNYIRNVTLSELADIYDGAKEGMTRAAMALEQDALFLEKATECEWKKLKKSEAKLGVDFFSKLHPAIKIRILRKWISSEIGRDYVPGYELLSRIDDGISRLNKRKDKNRIDLPLSGLKDMKIRVSGDAMRLKMRETGRQRQKKTKWNWSKTPQINWGTWSIKAKPSERNKIKSLSGNNMTALFDLAKMPQDIEIRSWSNGDTMRPFGFDKTVHLKKIFENKKIAEEEKTSYPVFCVPDTCEIIWLGGLRRSDFAPVEKSAKVLLFTLNRKNRH